VFPWPKLLVRRAWLARRSNASFAKRRCYALDEMTHAAELHPAWRDYRMWRRLLWVGLLGYLPAVMIVALIASRFSSSDTPAAYAALAWMSAWAICIIRVGWFRCPRCAKRFHINATRGWIAPSHPFFKRCLNCGLGRWEHPAGE
jgi:hypothetical protein